MRVKKNEKNRTRYRTVAFRMSELEWNELNERVALSGRRKQDYLIDSALNQELIVVGNCLMQEKIEAQLNEITSALEDAEIDGEIYEDVLLPLRTITEIVAKQ